MIYFGFTNVIIGIFWTAPMGYDNFLNLFQFAKILNSVMLLIQNKFFPFFFFSFFLFLVSYSLT